MNMIERHSAAKYLADLQITCKILLSRLTDLPFAKIDVSSLSVQKDTAILMIDKSIINLLVLPADMQLKIDDETETKFGFDIEYLVKTLRKICERSV